MMMSESNKRIADLIMKIAALSEEDINVLKRLSRKQPYVSAELASELYLLPSQVVDAVSHLSSEGFVELTETNTKWGGDKDEGYLLTSEGELAKKLMPIIETSEE